MITLIFGAHIPIGGGLDASPRTARELGCDSMQIFSRSPRTLKSKPLTEEEAERFRRAVADTGIGPVVVHTPYLLNLGSPKDETHKVSVQALIEDIRRADMLGAQSLVIHPGHHLGSGAAEAITRIALALDAAVEETGPKVALALENVAGAGTEVGATFSELADIIDKSKYGGTLKVCLDTCHAFAAGYDFSTAEGIDRALAELDSLIGIERIVAFHLNDSQGPLGAHKDRHAHIGEGHIGLGGFEALVSRPEFATLAGIAETPHEKIAYDLAALKSLVRS